MSEPDLNIETFCYVTTVGRVTGRPHTIEIWFAARDGTLYLLAGGRERSDWVRNVVRTPGVSVRLGDRRHSATARVVTDPDEERLARDLVFHKYEPSYGGDLTRWRESALPVAIDLDAGS